MTVNTKPAYNVGYLHFTGTSPTGPDCTALATSISTIWNTRIKPLVNPDVTLSGVEVMDVSTRTGAVGSVTVSILGTASSSGACPNNVALVLSFPVNYRYRGGHCRMYLPGQSTINMQTNRTNWLPAWITTTTNAGTSWLTDLAALTYGSTTMYPVMVSYYTHDANHNPIYRPGGPTYYRISTCVVHSRVDSQRRRLGREVS